MSQSGTFCFSVILTATGQERELYPSLDEMPPVLRATCVRALEGRNSATLLIADHGGRKALLEMMENAAAARQPAPQPEFHPTTVKTAKASTTTTILPSRPRLPGKWLGWLAMALSGSGLTLWLAMALILR